VLVSILCPSGTKGREITCDILNSTIKVHVRGSPILEGKLFAKVKADDSVWTLEDDDNGKSLEIELVKAEEHLLWKSVVEGKDSMNPFVEEQVNKKMMLERFQGEHAGFDFSGAEFTGQTPMDPKNFLRFDN